MDDDIPPIVTRARSNPSSLNEANDGIGGSNFNVTEDSCPSVESSSSSSSKIESSDSRALRQRRRSTIHQDTLEQIRRDRGRAAGLPARHDVPFSEDGRVVDDEDDDDPCAPEGWADRHIKNFTSFAGCCQDGSAAPAWKQWMERLLPITEWLQTYPVKKNLLTDIVAGLTVGVMVVPQSMSYAKLAGLPVQFGLYSSLVPIYAYAVFGSSRQLAVGPVALVSLLLNTGLEQYMRDTGRSPETTPDYESIYTTLAIQTAFLVGLCNIIMGFLRLGFVTVFLSHAVIDGFTSGAAIIIGVSQLKYIFGLSNIPNDKTLHMMLKNIFDNIDQFNYKTFLVGTGSLAVLMGLKKLSQMSERFKWVRPYGPLVVTVIAIIIQAAFDIEAQGVPIVGTIPSGLPSFTGNQVFPVEDGGSLAVTIISITIIGFLESIAIAKQLANKHGYHVDSSRELLGLGMANLASGMFSGYPVTGSFSRSAVNHESGAQSGISGIVTATIVMMVLLFLTFLFELLPLAVLAAIVISGVLGLVNIDEAKYLWKVHKFDLGVWIAAFLGTLFLGAEYGLGVAVAISVLIVLLESAYPPTSVLGRLPGTTHYRPIKQYPQAEVYDGILVIRIDAPMYFANTQSIREKVQKYEERYRKQALESSGPSSLDGLHYVILELSPVSHMDTSALHGLHEWVEFYQRQDNLIRLCLANPSRLVMKRLVSSGVADMVGREHIFVSVDRAVDECLRWLHDMELEALESNLETGNEKEWYKNSDPSSMATTLETPPSESSSGESSSIEGDDVEAPKKVRLELEATDQKNQ